MPVILRSAMLITLFLASSLTFAQSRQGTWEASFVLGYDDSIGENYGESTSLDIDSTVNWGFSLGYNWTEHININYRFMYSKPDYDASFVTEDGPTNIDHELSKYSNQLNLTYNFIDGPMTPFVTAGIGWTNIDSNVAKGEPSYGCWWDPWWGYICYEDWDSYDNSEFTYNLGLGAHWDFSDTMFARASFRREFMDVKQGSLDFDTFAIEIGARF